MASFPPTQALPQEVPERDAAAPEGAPDSEAAAASTLEAPQGSPGAAMLAAEVADAAGGDGDAGGEDDAEYPDDRDDRPMAAIPFELPGGIVLSDEAVAKLPEDGISMEVGYGLDGASAQISRTGPLWKSDRDIMQQAVLALARTLWKLLAWHHAFLCQEYYAAA